MNKLDPIYLDNGVIQIHPLCPADLIHINDFINDLYEIYGDIGTLPYNKEKFVEAPKTLSARMLGITLGYQQETNFTHFLTLKNNNKTIGEILILTPKCVEPTYNIKDTWILEYYLNKRFWNKGIMSSVIKAIVNIMQAQGIKEIGSLVNRENSPSIRVLEKSGFRKIRQYDAKQDYFHI